MNNEPVAWIIDVNMTDCNDNFIWNTGGYPDWQVKDWIPLYTHPAKELDEQFKKGFEAGSVEGWKAHKFLYPAKTLTDEVLMQLYEVADYSPESYLEEARAILRKAQEK